MKITIHGVRYSDIPKHYPWDDKKRYKYFDSIAEEKWEIEGNSLDEGEKWLAQNHPDMYMGGSIVCENGDFSLLAVPSGEYGEGNYETTQARIAWVKAYAM